MDFNFSTETISPDNTGILTIGGVAGLELPSGTTAERPVSELVNGIIRYNSDTGNIEGYANNLWLTLDSGTVTSVAISGSTGLSVSGSPITTSGTISLTLGTELQGISLLSSTGMISRTGSGTYLSRTITGTSGNITLTNGDGVSGNPTINLSTLGTPVSASFVKITTDTFGRVSATTPVVAADITGLVNSEYVNVTGDSMSGNLVMTGGATVTGLPDPTNSTDAATKNYVDNAISGLSWKQSVQTMSTTNVNIANPGTDTFGGHTVTIGQRLLLTGQTTSSEDGIYVFDTTSTPLVRSPDANTYQELNGAAVFVEQGTYADTGWVQTATLTSLSSPQTWVQFSGSNSYVAGTGLTLSGNTFSITAPVTPLLGGTGTITTPSSGQVLIGTSGSIYSPATVGSGSGISVTSGSGSLSIANTGVLSNVAGTGISVSGATGNVTITNSGVTSIAGTAGNITASAATGSVTLNLATAGTAGTYGQVTTDAFGRVTSGTTVNSVANGGTGLSTLGAANRILGVNPGATALEYKTVTAGTGITVTPAAGSITIAAVNNGTVTSVALSLPSIFTVSGSPVTTSGTLTGTLATQSANTLFAGPASGGAATPTFRTISLSQNDLSDVVITIPTNGQVLSYNSGTTKWVNSGTVGANATGLIGVGQTGAAAWTLLSGNRYYADFAHNLGTTNVVIGLYNVANDAIIGADSIVVTNANTVRVTVIGNTRTLRVVVIANGQSIVAGGSTPSSVITSLSGVTVNTAATKLNFVGAAVNVTDAGSGTSNISIGARYTYFANSLDSPNNADYAVNSLAPVITDPTYNSMSVRSFSNTVEQGVAFMVSIPSGSTQMTIKVRGRAQTAPGVVSAVQYRLYYRLVPNNSAIGAWSSAQEFSNISIPTNANFQYAQQTVSLSTLGLTSGNLYQFELTRRVAGVSGTNLASAFLMTEVDTEFS